jgi:GNAT superfamily N-acetyltransferase
MTTGIAPAPRWTTRRTATTPPIAVGPAGPADAAALRAMHDRCGPATRYARFHGLLRELPEGYLAGALAGDPAVHDALVVEVAAPGGRRLVGLGSACRLDRPGPPAADVGLLVEDAWQRLGIGTELMSHMAGLAQALGYHELIAYPATAMVAAQRLMLEVGRTRVVPDADAHLHTYLPESAALGLGSVRQRLAG